MRLRLYIAELILTILLSRIVQLIKLWLSLGSVCPMSTLKRWIKRLSKVARTTHRLAVCSWNGASNTLEINGRSINVDVYFATVRRSLFELGVFIREKVLRGFQVDQHYTFPKSSNEDFTERKLGFGLFWQEHPTKLSNVSSRAFTDHLGSCDQAILGKDYQGRLHWNPVRRMEWLSQVDEAWQRTFPLMHVTTLPARAPEILHFQVLNSQASIRHIMLYNDTLATLSNYNKTTSTTDVNKHILRILPKSLAIDLAIMLEVVRPVELLAVTHQRGTMAPSKEPVRLDKLYRRHIFITDGTPWTPVKLAAVLRRWFQANFNLPWGINRHRHMAKNLTHIYIKHEDQTSLELAYDGAMGHGREGARNYAVRMDQPPLPGDLLQLYRTVSEQWISMHGLKTFEPTDLKAVLEEDAELLSAKSGVPKKGGKSSKAAKVTGKTASKRGGKRKGKAKAFDSEDEWAGGDYDDDEEDEDEEHKVSWAKDDDEEYVPRRSSRRKK